MANYRFKTAEIEAMKQNILTHIGYEAETKTAWRLRCAIEGQLMCCRPSKREAARKPQNRGIVNTRTTRRDTLRDTLRPVTYVPRECSTADYW